MRDKMRKRAQSKINKSVRMLNKNIKNDSLWRGRFVIRQINAYWYKFEDHSGGELAARLQIRDLKTGLYANFSVDNFDVSYRLWLYGNEFIAEHSGVWNDINEVKNDTTDWGKVKWHPKKEIYCRGF